MQSRVVCALRRSPRGQKPRESVITVIDNLKTERCQTDSRMRSITKSCNTCTLFFGRKLRKQLVQKLLSGLSVQKTLRSNFSNRTERVHEETNARSKKGAEECEEHTLHRSVETGTLIGVLFFFLNEMNMDYITERRAKFW